jgi:3-hydroxyacyl-CoA dehydrogenase
MLLEGAAPGQIDAALEEWGMALGPNAVADLAGLDVGYRVRREREDSGEDPCYFRPADLLAEMGRYGQKTGRGFYQYEPGSWQRRPDPDVSVLIRREAERLAVPQREISDTEIVERCVYSLINEGARILEEGVASSASDIDVIWVNGYGFPRTRGGPMFFADSVGLAHVLAVIEKYQRARGARYWTPSPLVRTLAAGGQSFGR